MNNETIKKQIEAFNRLYILSRYPYIQQMKEGYVYSSSLPFDSKLTDSVVKKHLEKKITIGVFSNKHYTKFITFDFDMEGYSILERQSAVNNVKKEVRKLGIDDRFTSTSISGSKGYHYTIYFNQSVYLNLAYDFYEYVVYNSGLNNKICEFRPTNTQGVKLPLSINRKTNKYCGFVDEYFNIIKDENYICDIQGFDSDIFHQEAIKLELTNEQIKQIRKIQSVCASSKFSLMTESDVKLLETNGLPCKGVRNYCCVQLVIYYNTIGLDKYEAEDRINKWIKNQDKDKHTTSLKSCYSENSKIVNWVYNKNITLRKSLPDNIKICKGEMIKILDIPDTKARSVAFSMLIHSKIYKNKNGEFSMTYKQILENSNFKNRNEVKRCIDYLEENKFITIISRNIYKKSNKYIVNFSNTRNRNVILTVNDYTICYNNFYSSLDTVKVM